MAAIFVVYPARAGMRFDRDYYLETHLPLVKEAWGPCGLLSGELYTPAQETSANVAVAILVFANDDDAEGAFKSPDTPKLMADIANFTNIEPILSRGLAL